MSKTCIFDQNCRCPIWLDYDVTLDTLQQAEELCHGNRIEITRLRRWTNALTAILDAHGLSCPSEWDIDDGDEDDDTPRGGSGSDS